MRPAPLRARQQGDQCSTRWACLRIGRPDGPGRGRPSPGVALSPRGHGDTPLRPFARGADRGGNRPVARAGDREGVGGVPGRARAGRHVAAPGALQGEGPGGSAGCAPPGRSRCHAGADALRRRDRLGGEAGGGLGQGRASRNARIRAGGGESGAARPGRNGGSVREVAAVPGRPRSREVVGDPARCGTRGGGGGRLAAAFGDCGHGGDRVRRRTGSLVDGSRQLPGGDPHGGARQQPGGSFPRWRSQQVMGRAARGDRCRGSPPDRPSGIPGSAC